MREDSLGTAHRVMSSIDIPESANYRDKEVQWLPGVGEKGSTF